MQSKIIKYYIVMPSEYAAGIRGFDDTVTIMVDSGDPGGDTGEFEQFMMDCLKEWYDGGNVSIISTQEE